MGNVTFGYDVSHYQGNFNHAQAYREGYRFCLAKCSQGSTYTDPKFDHHRDAALKAGMLFGAYHYVSGSNSASAQAAHVASVIGDKSIPVMIDHEASSGNEGMNCAVIDQVRERGYRVILNYYPRWYWQQTGSPKIRRGPLASSRYVRGSGLGSALYGHVTRSMWQGYGGQPVAIVQFTSSGLVAKQKIDLDAYPGTLAQLTQLFHGNAPVTVAQTTKVKGGDDVSKQDVLDGLRDYFNTEWHDVPWYNKRVSLRNTMLGLYDVSSWNPDQIDPRNSVDFLRTMVFHQLKLEDQVKELQAQIAKQPGGSS